jgi:hypothetical protein
LRIRRGRHTIKVKSKSERNRETIETNERNPVRFVPLCFHRTSSMSGA